MKKKSISLTKESFCSQQICRENGRRDDIYNWTSHSRVSRYSNWGWWWLDSVFTELCKVIRTIVSVYLWNEAGISGNRQDFWKRGLKKKWLCEGPTRVQGHGPSGIAGGGHKGFPLFSNSRVSVGNFSHLMISCGTLS